MGRPEGFSDPRERVDGSWHPRVKPPRPHHVRGVAGGHTGGTAHGWTQTEAVCPRPARLSEGAWVEQCNPPGSAWGD